MIQIAVCREVPIINRIRFLHSREVFLVKIPRLISFREVIN